MNEVVIDVRERDEFDSEHVEHSINVPLSHFAEVAPGILNQLTEKKLSILCRSGSRARMAAQQINLMGFTDKIDASVYEGGILKWKLEGKPTIQRRANHLPIMRQVQLAAGLMVLATSLLGAFVNPWFLAISAFVGAGLTVAGSTGFCGLAMLLAKMPWNRVGVLK